MIRFGLVSFAHVHSDGYAWALKTIQDHDGSARLVAVSDSDAARGEPKAKEWGARFFSDYREMITTEHVDAVIISSENSRHLEEVSAAVSAGVHIICEKPIAISVEQLEKMRAEMQKHKTVVFQTAFVCRFSPSVVEAKRLIDGGTLGAIRAISSTNHGRYPGGWFGDRELSGGGAVIDHTVHAADAIRLLTNQEFGAVRAFRGKNLRADISVEDNALIYARMDRTAIPVSIDCSWSRHDKWPIWGDLQMTIICQKGVIKIDAFKPHINVSTSEGFQWHSLGEDLNVKLIRSFCNAIVEHMGQLPAVQDSAGSYVHDKSLRAGFEDGARAAAVALAAYASIDQESHPVPAVQLLWGN